jgi:hypothetical protein
VIIKYPSTYDEPLKFFTWFYTKNTIEDFKDWFYDDVPAASDQKEPRREPRLNPSQVSNREEGYIEYRDHNNNFDFVKSYLEDEIEKLIKIQVSKAIEFINQNMLAHIEEPKDSQRLLKLYINDLTAIEKTIIEKLSANNTYLKSVFKIEQYLKSRYLKSEELDSDGSLISETPLSFYYDLAFNDELEKVLSAFLNNSTLINDLVLDEPNGDDSDILDRDKYFKNILAEKKKDLYQSIKDDTSKGERKSILTICFDELLIIINKIEYLKEEEHYNYVYSDLKTIISDLKLQYNSVIGHHAVFNKIRVVNTTLSYFQCKEELPINFFQKLYILTYELDLIDDSLVTEEMFIDVLTSIKPANESTITFIKTNPVVACYLKGIEIFFNNLNSVTIENSNCFINKNGKSINRSDLYAAKSRGGTYPIFQDIKDGIDELVEEYLK